MYKRIVASQVHRVWDALGRRDQGPALQGFARTFTYEAINADHALGGTFHTVDEVAAHFDVMFALLPDVEFVVRDVLVRGWLGNTAVVVRVGLTAPLPDGSWYVNELVQYMRMRWGKVTEVRALVDNLRARAAVALIQDAAAPAAVRQLTR